ncbi:DUF1003 domain-containing protein [Streptococcus pseudoporcinus]|uniref:PF06210 family protein n=2 Tax=Streptococcus pseudoporcinus TaxID=361101 RepID=G5K6K5_9STRE|nr:DUF1003 domain-containing protein [Streptococcus pseudoporcinus]EFR44815.1 hypothetical protein HMPREF9320_1509 [Streptococcus pseudoporcinus SPIN 20026]EHI65959.1 hypothetical protein STRPS_0092 [Streptococcus pseudoporcinus LQ 940-04]VEF94558.1 membrane protein [Streptococcus pseudoporcinus]VTS13326.1 membrane protein [Streptococcus pseudoporcinus]VUC66518.1 membrane protein [Streptococcus pseudoporcinus]
MNKKRWVIDAIDGGKYLSTEGVFLYELDEQLQALIMDDHPELDSTSFISQENLATYRLNYLDEMIASAKLKNEAIREMVNDVSKNNNYAILNVQDQLDSKITFGQRLADQVARFGGTWTFIITFIIFMAIWMGFNIINPFGLAFDKYPFILLNLALSTIAAIQAPLIMMSQNRASEYDRLQAKNDYQVNKTSEEGVRLLHSKIDHLVLQDQSDLMQIQKLQTEILLSITKQLNQVQILENDVLTPDAADIKQRAQK